MAKYKKPEYYLDLFKKNKKNGISCAKISEYLKKSGKNRFDSNIPYNHDYVKKILNEGLFDPNVFDAIVFCSKLDDMRKYFKENIIDDTSWSYMNISKDALLKRINTVKSGTKK